MNIIVLIVIRGSKDEYIKLIVINKITALQYRFKRPETNADQTNIVLNAVYKK